MDELPKCSHDPAESPNRKEKDQSAESKDQPATSKSQTVVQDQSPLSKNETTLPEEPLIASKNETVSWKKQSTEQNDQSILVKSQTVSQDQSTSIKTHTELPKDQTAFQKTCTVSRADPSTSNQYNSLKEQSSSEKNQPTIHDQPATSKKQTTPVPLRDPLPSVRYQTNLLLDQMALAKQLNSSINNPSTSARNQTVPQKDQSASSRNQPPTPKGSLYERRPPGNVESRISFCIARVASNTLSYSRNNSYLNSYAPLMIRSSAQSPITTQPRLSQLPSPASVAIRTQPQSLFLQALSKLNESSLTMSVINHLRLLQSNSNLSKVVNLGLKSGDITPPDSLTSAPPSYSFVLRQMAVRRRPRLMGTFFPSPSFVQHTPPPTYTTAFDVYIEPAVPPPPPRVYTFGFASMPIVCPECGYTGMTVVTSRITICTHLCAFILCLLCCWICAPLPYILRSCKDVYHYCRNCRSFLGMYCPTNPESAYP